MSKIMQKKKKAVNEKSEISFDDGLLFIDCRPCSGRSSFGDIDCVKCISKKIAEHGTPSRLMMRKENDVEHSENIITVMNDIAKIDSLVSTAASEKLSNRCKGCPCSLAKNAKDIWDSFPEPRFDIFRVETERSNPGKEGCEDCVWRTIGFIDRTETMFTDVKKKAAKIAFRLAEV